jgi:endonuclease-3 related protein
MGCADIVGFSSGKSGCDENHTLQQDMLFGVRLVSHQRDTEPDNRDAAIWSTENEEQNAWGAIVNLARLSRIEITIVDPIEKVRHETIRAYYNRLFSIWGQQHWWPAQSRFEMIVGAYLTQNTAWTNVAQAIVNLRRARLLTLSGIRNTPQSELETLIRPAGYFRQKAQRLKTFVRFLDERYEGSLTKMFSRPADQLREELLALNGVGPETADSILLYAGNHPVFVVDAYTRRIFERHQIISSAANYEEIRGLFEQALSNTDVILTATASTTTGSAPAVLGPRGSCHRPSRMSTTERAALVQIFNEMHGLIVGVGKTYCLKSQPRCELCPLQEFLPAGKVNIGDK